MIAFITFLRANDLGNYQPTIAAQAFTAYRHRFMPEPLYIDDDVKALAMARAAYHGGRTEAFWIGSQSGDYTTLDVNSMYPYVMCHNWMPVKLVTVLSAPTLSELSKYLTTHCVVAEVTLDTDEPVYAMIDSKRLVFPLGKFGTTLTTPELVHALAHDHITNVRRAAIYTRGMIFNDYVTTLYELRKRYQADNNTAFAWLCKIMLNSLYGKMGQLGRVYDEIGECDKDDVRTWIEIDGDTHQTRKLRSFGGVVQELKTDGESYNSHPAIAAHVTAHGRMMLWRLIQTAGIDNVLYCDTDSITVNADALSRLPPFLVGSELGFLKVERKFTNITIHGPKDYVFGDHVCIKGIRKNAEELTPGTFKQLKFSKFKGMIRRGDIDTMIVEDIIKTLRREYNKGVVLDDGRVRPFRYPDEDAYHRWLTKLHEPKLVYGEFNTADEDHPQFKGARVEDDIARRRAKSLPYQR